MHENLFCGFRTCACASRQILLMVLIAGELIVAEPFVLVGGADDGILFVAAQVVVIAPRSVFSC